MNAPKSDKLKSIIVGTYYQLDDAGKRALKNIIIKERERLGLSTPASQGSHRY